MNAFFSLSPFFVVVVVMPCSSSSNSTTQATFSKSWDARTASTSIITQNTTCFDFFFRHKQFISFRFSTDFCSLFFCLSHFESQLYLVVRFVARKKNVPKTFPRCNICHVLYPVNWRFSIVTKQFFFVLFVSIRCVCTVSVIVIVFYFLCSSVRACAPCLKKSLHLHENNIISQYQSSIHLLRSTNQRTSTELRPIKCDLSYF